MASREQQVFGSDLGSLCILRPNLCMGSIPMMIHFCLRIIRINRENMLTWETPKEEKKLAQQSIEIVNKMNAGESVDKFNGQMAMYLLVLLLEQSRHPLVNSILLLDEDVESLRFLDDFFVKLRKDHMERYRITNCIINTLVLVTKGKYRECLDRLVEAFGPALIRSTDKHVEQKVYNGMRVGFVRSIITNIDARRCFAPDDKAIYENQPPTTKHW